MKKTRVILSLLACFVLAAIGFAGCGESHVHDFSETWSYDAEYHWHKCTDETCEEVSGKEAHKGGTATHTAKAICEVCGQEYGEKIAEHNFVLKIDGEYHWYECECGEIQGEKVAHTLEGKFDTEGHWQECECGYTTDKIAHTLEDKFDTEGHWQECECGYATEKVAHTLEGKFDAEYHWTECECGYATEKVAHTLEGKFDADYHWTECECGYATEKVAHTLEGKFDADYHWTECECGYATEKVAHTLEGKFDADYHWTECECGYATEKVAHTLEGKFDAEGHWQECECGYTTEKQPHISEGTYDADGHWVVCDCGYTTEKQAHTLENKYDDDYHWTGCECGYATEKVAHTLEGKFDAEGHWQECECGYTTEKVAHELVGDYDAESHWTECDCGYATDKVAHTLETKSDAESHWQECDCGYATDKADHELVFKYDDDHHWQECDCGYATDKVAHTLEIKSDAESHWQECDCGYATDKADHELVFKYDDDHHWQECDCGYATEKQAHVYTAWDTEDDIYDYAKCECGKESDIVFRKAVIKSITQTLTMTDNSFAIELMGVSEYESVVSIKLGEYDLGTDISALNVSNELKADGQSHGEQNIIVVVTTADGFEHTVKVPVLIITRNITSLDDFKTYIQLSEVNKARYGYYVQTADINDTSLGGSGYTDWEATTGFMGTYDGGGYFINAAANSSKGIFGIVRNATIKNLTVKDAWSSNWPAPLVAKGIYNTTFENVAFTWVNGSSVTADKIGWVCTTEFSNNVLNNVTVTAPAESTEKQIGLIFGNKFWNNTFINFTVSGQYQAIGFANDIIDNTPQDTGEYVYFEDIQQQEEPTVEVTKVTFEERQELDLSDNSAILDLKEYSDYEVIKVTVSETDIGYISSLYIYESFKNAKQLHGETKVIVTVEKGGKVVEITIPVTVITKTITTMNDLISAVKVTDATAGVGDKYGYYVLGNNVAWNDEGATSVSGACGWASGAAFRGTLDGRGYAVTISTGNYSHGLFSVVNGATVKNITLNHAWYNGSWAQAVIAYCGYNTVFDNVTINISGGSSAATATGNNAPIIGANSYGCTFNNVTITSSIALGELFGTFDNPQNTFEGVTVTLPALTKFANNVETAPSGVTVNLVA